MLSDHTNQFGLFSDARTVADYERASWAAYPGGSSSIDDPGANLKYIGTGSFHKVNRNGRRQPKYSNEFTGDPGIISTSASYDNFFVQHQIPQTDVQYAWITASLINDYTGSALYGFEQPDFEYNDKASFITATGKCVDFLNFTNDKLSRVPTSMIIAMAGIESGWGTSRFATEGNALFGVRTWDDTVPQMKPRDLPDANFGVKKYITKCDSVKDMIRILNTHPAYEQFRKAREHQIDKGKWNYKELLAGITAWSTNPEYVKIIWTAIVDNNLP